MKSRNAISILFLISAIFVSCTDLYFYDREPLLHELSSLIDRLSEYREALVRDDRETMRALLREGRLAHDKFFSEK